MTESHDISFKVPASLMLERAIPGSAPIDITICEGEQTEKRLQGTGRK